MPVDRRIVLGGIAVGGVAVGYVLYQQNKKKKAQTAAAQAQAAQAAAGQTYAYGSAGSSNFAYGYGAGQTYMPYGYGYGPEGLGSYGYGGFTPAAGGYYGAGVATEVPTQATTNAQWSQAAYTALTNAGYDGTSVLAALGQYLIGGSLTADQNGIVTAAIAAEGYPPQPGADGYPPAINTGGTPGGGQPGSQTGQYAGAISNLQPSAVTRTGFTVTWNPVPNTTGYHWAVGTTQAWPNYIKQGTSSTPKVVVTGLNPGTAYNFGVQALPGGAGNNIHVTTSR
jgi:Fibronectin type III domain